MFTNPLEIAVLRRYLAGPVQFQFGGKASGVRVKVTELGPVTLKIIGFFCFPIKHSTHTRISLCVGGGIFRQAELAAAKKILGAW